MVATGSGLDGVGGDLDVAIGAVFEADGGRQARGQLAVHLAFGRARANRAPGDQITQVLRRDHVQKLAARRQAHPVDFDQQLARNAQAFVDAKALVQVRVVDQALPAHRGAGLLKIHAHHNFQRVGVFVTLHLERAGVLQRSHRIVDGARANDDQHAVIGARHDVLNVVARGGDQRLDGRAADGEEADEMFRRWQHGDVLDAFVIGTAGAVVGAGLAAVTLVALPRLGAGSQRGNGGGWGGLGGGGDFDGGRSSGR